MANDPMTELREAPRARLTVDLAGEEDGSPLARLTGELDMNTVPELETKLAPIMRSSPERLIIDVGALEFADSSAIALWVRWANVVRELEIRNPSLILRRVIERMGLAERLGLGP
jgi:anti-sigma B factor antagonist